MASVICKLDRSLGSIAIVLLIGLVCEARLIPTNNGGFIGTKGTDFVLNGSPFYFNGFNAYWMMHVAAQSSERSKVTQVFHDAAAAGLTICRTWAFSDGGDQALQISPGVYDEPVFQRVITRLNTITKTIYRDDPTIMAWELINEPRSKSDYSGKTINDWVGEMAAYVKSIDNKHLLEVGMEGFYGDSMPDRKQFNPGYQVGTDFITNNLISDIDFSTIHAYPDIWLSGQNDESQMAFMDKWVESHWTDSRTILKKPMVIAEFGKSSKDPGYSIHGRDSYMNTVYGTIDNLAKKGGTISGTLVWQLMASGMEPYHDGYEIILSENLSTEEVISRQSNQMAGLSH
ncbi:mannan endo-1,4-beta-mannosidase 1-like isoform X2 [Diospyros lotus]|uniref:mannan endo-1,4-beta-mannosidase 1-like isoform X2 n=1 Tax=Diospyros lotus TaxID=55363 RepID=UPI00224F10E8|nr:mannan endo-1,4-beta-mannosidase 1-like isoform X2 [Diospyros lotus]